MSKRSFCFGDGRQGSSRQTRMENSDLQQTIYFHAGDLRENCAKCA